MRNCTICSRGFTKPYNLRRHYLRFHPTELAPKLERQARDALGQTGGGDIFGSNDEGSDTEEDSEEAEDSASDISDDDEQEAMDDQPEAERDNENWVFESMLEDTIEELGEDASDKNIQRLFQRKFVDEVVWSRNFRKHPIYKKITKTANDLEAGVDDYDREEALRAATKQRSFLFERLIAELMPIVNDKGDGGGNVEDEHSDSADEEADGEQSGA